MTFTYTWFGDVQGGKKNVFVWEKCVLGPADEKA